MNVTSIISEYNPFHNGHLYHINQSKALTKSDYLVVVMSGNFVQRGDLAFLDKYARTEMALKNGADLVIELPVYYACASAFYFAHGAVSILDATGIADSIVFGSEDGNIGKLQQVSQFLTDENPTYKSILKENLNTGISYPKARNNTLEFLNEDFKGVLNTPNNILGVEYLIGLKNLNSKIKPYTIKRTANAYHDEFLTGNISSATSIRQALMKNDSISVYDSMPENVKAIVKREISDGNSHVNLDDFSSIMNYIIRTKPAEYLKEILDIDEGLENKLISTISNNQTISGIVKGLKSKRYTQTKLQRAIIHLLLGINKTDFNCFNENGYGQYIRVLGFKKESSFLLREMEERSRLPIVTNLKNAHKNLDSLAMKMLNKEIESTDIYLLARKGKSYGKNHEYKVPLVMI